MRSKAASHRLKPSKGHPGDSTFSLLGVLEGLQQGRPGAALSPSPSFPPNFTTCVTVVSLLIQETRSRCQHIFTGFQSRWNLCKDMYTYCLSERHS